MQRPHYFLRENARCVVRARFVVRMCLSVYVCVVNNGEGKGERSAFIHEKSYHATNRLSPP